MRYWKEWKSYEETKAMVYQEEKRGRKKTSSTRDSRGIPDLSTKRARRVLTALFEMGRGVCLLGVAARDESDGKLRI